MPDWPSSEGENFPLDCQDDSLMDAVIETTSKSNYNLLLTSSCDRDNTQSVNMKCVCQITVNKIVWFG